MAFVDPSEADVKPESATELTRARRLVSPEFVDKMKEKFKQGALGRIQTEKEVDFRMIPTNELIVFYSPLMLPSRKRIVRYVTTS